jgi:hypothetical protein
MMVTWGNGSKSFAIRDLVASRIARVEKTAIFTCGRKTSRFYSAVTWMPHVVQVEARAGSGGMRPTGGKMKAWLKRLLKNSGKAFFRG